jgi:hypothetical protein
MQVQDLEEAAARIGKNVAKLGRDIKHWEVWQWIRERIDTFKRTAPLISDLRNPAMRPRHWNSLVDAIQTSFDPTSDTFTLDSIVALRLDQHAEFISEMSLNATKELAIEQSLAAIAEAWKTLDLDMVRGLSVNLPAKAFFLPCAVHVLLKALLAISFFTFQMYASFPVSTPIRSSVSMSRQLE